jgi:hypothetical protein
MPIKEASVTCYQPFTECDTSLKPTSLLQVDPRTATKKDVSPKVGGLTVCPAV